VQSQLIVVDCFFVSLPLVFEHLAAMMKAAIWKRIPAAYTFPFTERQDDYFAAAGSASFDHEQF
jgi:hypothetical protein